jgi:adenylate kinase
MIIILTGTPGTGKDTVAMELGRKGFVWLSLNNLIKQRRLWKKKEKGCLVADMKGLEKEIRKEISKLRKNENDKIIVEGHLACEFRVPADICIVLRTNPETLRKRLERRKYPKMKIDDNILCEELDYCTQKAEVNMKCPVYEVRTDKSIPGTLRDVNSIIDGRGKKFRAGWVDWSGRLLQRKRI